jgi:outer membrane protein assembly factor BamB
MAVEGKQEISAESLKSEQLRLLPGVVIVALQWVIRFVIPIFAPKVMALGVFGGLLGGLAVLVWWLFFSKASRVERWGAILLIIAALTATSFFLDKSIATANMGLMFIIYSVPVMCLAFVAWAVATRGLSLFPRRVTMVITIILASGIWIFLRTNGMTGDGRHDLAWRWAQTDEDRLLAQSGSGPLSLPEAQPKEAFNTEWPGFRGINRDGTVHGVKISTGWSLSPPVEMWRRPVGPGCSSFAVHGNLLYTQEQRGEYEVVSCYYLTNGQPVWQHKDKARFYDSHAGAGPRSTPTLEGSRIYTLGATGILNVLDANGGSVIWSRDAASETGVKVLNWGFTSSPLVVGDVVIVALSGKLAAYDTQSGKPLWFGPDGGSSYSSPQLFTINGVSQALLMSNKGAVSVDPESGKILWEYPWEVQDRILQPSLIENGDLLLCAENKSIRRITVSGGPDKWMTSEGWTSSGIMVNFNDFVIHKGYAYGFDGPAMVCIDLRDGKRMWRGARYRGFLLLLADQNLILVLSEKGELALVQADPHHFNELSLFPAIKGKTWNHPVLAGNILVVRNAQEMAAFRLPVMEKEK